MENKISINEKIYLVIFTLIQLVATVLQVKKTFVKTPRPTQVDFIFAIFIILFWFTLLIIAYYRKNKILTKAVFVFWRFLFISCTIEYSLSFAGTSSVFCFLPFIIVVTPFWGFCYSGHEIRFLAGLVFSAVMFLLGYFLKRKLKI